MRGVVVVVVVVVGLVGGCLGLPGPLTPTPRFKAQRQTPQFRIGDLIQEFGLDVSAELRERGNLAVSPLSLSVLLSVLMMGSAGGSYQQLRQALRLPATTSDADIHSFFQNVLSAISSTGSDITVTVSNGLFLQKNADVLPSFIQKAQTYYNSDVDTLDFERSASNATSTINKWVSDRTKGLIPQLYTQPLSPYTTFVAVNTVFFNGKWETPFPLDMTEERAFNTGKETLQVPMMSNVMPINYIDLPDLDVEIAALPYKGHQMAMYIILPRNSSTNLEELELGLTTEQLNTFIAGMVPVKMKVWLPRMRLRYKTSMQECLQRLHVTSIFRPSEADFSLLTTKKVWVDDVVHEVVIEVTETGTKAAAASGTSLNRIGSSRAFLVDRPAIFFIRDLNTGVPLFWGRIVKPEPLRG